MSAEIAERGLTIDGEIIESRAPLTLFGTDDPAAVVERATKVATVLADVIKQRRLSTHIGNRDHIQIEGWTLLGSMLGVFGEVEWTRSLEDGWEARAVARTMAGVTVGSAEAMCTRRERTWASRDEYAIRSMAQTRALSKALRLPLGFIVELAGFAATPLEEMDGIEQPERGARGGERPSGQAPSSPSGAPAPAPRTKGAALSLIADAAKAHGLSFGQIEEKAKELGINRGEASIEDLMRLWGAIETPQSEGSPASAGSDAATTQGSGVEAVSPGTPPDPAPAPSIEDILAVTGGTAVPPQPGTDEFKALPPAERATARVYHQTHAEPARPDAEELRMGLES